MHRPISVLVALVIAFWFGCRSPRQVVQQPVEPPRPSRTEIRAEEPIVRVLLKENFQTVLVEGSTRAPRIEATAMPEGVKLTRIDEGVRQVLDTGSGFRLEPVADNLRVDGADFMGAVELFFNPHGVPIVVNELPLEVYLASVVPAEIGPLNDPVIEAVKAQSVAARTYTVAHLGTNASRGFDLFGDTRSQVYPGTASRKAISDQAVSETRGLIATFRGQPIVALYSSTCGGTTEGFHNVFRGAPIEYLQGGVICHDENSPYHEWRQRIDLEAERERVEQTAGVGKIRKVVPVRRSPAGRVLEMRFEGENGSRELAGTKVRQLLQLRSTYLVSIGLELDAKGLLKVLDIEGRGYGHGVGLCQFGAMALAAEGQGFESILKHYYPGVGITMNY